MERADFVPVPAQGSRCLYSLRPEPFRELERWLVGYRGLWEARLDRFANALEKRKAQRNPSRKEPKGAGGLLR